MSYDPLNLGAAPDDDTGDTLRAGGEKLNAMLEEIYQTLLIGAGVNEPVLAITTNAGTSPEYIILSPDDVAHFAAIIKIDVPTASNLSNSGILLTSEQVTTVLIAGINSLAGGRMMTTLASVDGDCDNVLNSTGNQFCVGLDHSANQWKVAAALTLGTNADGIAVDSESQAATTRLHVWDVDSGELQRVACGNPNSGGAGWKLLRIPN